MKLVLLILFAVIDLGCLAFAIYLWRSSQYSGAEIGTMDGGLAKIFGIAFVMITLLIAGIIWFKK